MIPTHLLTPFCGYVESWFTLSFNFVLWLYCGLFTQKPLLFPEKPHFNHKKLCSQTCCVLCWAYPRKLWFQIVEPSCYVPIFDVGFTRKDYLKLNAFLHQHRIRQINSTHLTRRYLTQWFSIQNLLKNSCSLSWEF